MHAPTPKRLWAGPVIVGAVLAGLVAFAATCAPASERPPPASGVAAAPPPPDPTPAEAPAPPPPAEAPADRDAPPPDPTLAGPVAALYSDTHPPLADADVAPWILLYFQGGTEGGVKVYSGDDHDPEGENPWLDRRRRGDAVEGETAMWYRRPPLGASSPAIDAKNASGRILWRTFTPDDGAPFDVGRYRYFNLWVKPLDGWEGHLGLTLGSWDPAEGGRSGDAGVAVKRLFPQRVEGGEWQCLSIALDRFDGFDPARFAKYMIDFGSDADGHAFLFDDLTLSERRPAAAGPPVPNLYAIAEPGEDPSTAPDRLTVTVDPAVTHQTIRGFGFMGESAQARLLVGDLGASLVRVKIPARDPPDGEPATRDNTVGWEPVNDDDDPRSFTRSLDGFDAADLSRTLRSMRAYRAMDPDIGFFACPWSPPGWMKVGGRVAGGARGTHFQNTIRQELLPEYGEYLASFALHLHREGLPLVALSMGNEVHFKHQFASMILVEDQMVEAIRQVDRMLGHATREVPGFERPLLTADDHVLKRHFEGDFDRLFEKLAAAPDARDALDVVSYHAYGVEAQLPETASTTLIGRVRDKARRTFGDDVELWMTESSGFHHGLLDQGRRKGALGLAEGLYTSLVYADVSAWIYFGTEELVHYERLSWPGTALRHFARFVRPGAVRVDARIDGARDRVLVTAFRHAGGAGAGPTMTVVLVNLDDTPHGLDLSRLPGGGAGGDRWREHRSSAHHACDPMGTIDPAATARTPYVLPPHGIVTLHRGPAGARGR